MDTKELMQGRDPKRVAQDFEYIYQFGRWAMLIFMATCVIASCVGCSKVKEFVSSDKPAFETYYVPGTCSRNDSDWVVCTDYFQHAPELGMPNGWREAGKSPHKSCEGGGGSGWHCTEWEIPGVEPPKHWGLPYICLDKGWKNCGYMQPDPHLTYHLPKQEEMELFIVSSDPVISELQQLRREVRRITKLMEEKK